MTASEAAPMLHHAAALLSAGRLAEAQAICERLLAGWPDDPDGLHLLGLVRFRQGDQAAGVDLLSRALDLAPDSPLALINLGAMQEEMGNDEAAAACFAAALDLTPDDQPLRHRLGRLLYRSGDPAGAEAAYRQALAGQPDFAAAACDLGFALRAQGKSEEAQASFGRAAAAYRALLAAGRGTADDYFGFGVTLQMSGDYAGAETAYRRVRELAPQHEQALHNLIAILSGQGRPREAIAALREALAIRPNDRDLHRALLTAILYDPDLDAAARFAEHERFAARFGVHGTAPAVLLRNARDPERPLRVGWVSSDFHAEHPVPRNLEPILRYRDRAKFAAICYANVPRPDHVTARFQDLADAWRRIDGRSDEEIAALVRADEIDILVILAGRFDHNRPLVAAYRAAPVQVSLFDAATSGLTEIDYLIADPVLVPRHGDEPFTERVVRLPNFYVHAPLIGAPPVAELPMLTGHPVTFGSLNNPIKINDRVLRLWAAILREVPGSRLLLHYRNRFAPLRGRIAAVLAGEGISADRLDVAESFPESAGYLSLYNRIDVALDPFPFNGSTTTFEALWMGVPVVTLAGTTFMGRWTASMLHSLKFDELIARTPDDYVATAVAWARSPERLAVLRKTLRDRVAASPLCDGPGRARHVERLFRAMWRRWCRSGVGGG